MSRRAILLLTCCGGILFVAMALTAISDPSQIVSGFVKGESFYRGRPTSYWRGQIAQAISANSSLQAIEMMFEDGWGSGVIIECTNDRDRKVRAVCALLLYDCRYSSQIVKALERLLEDRDEIVVKTAVQSLAAFGRRSKSAVPALLTLSQGKNEYLQWASRTALWSIDQQAAIKLECWEKFEREDLEFSAEMPTPVNVVESSVPGSGGKLAVASFESQTWPATYIIAVSETMPEAVEEIQAEGGFDEHVRIAAEHQQCDIVNKEIGQHHGRLAYCWTLRKQASDESITMDVQTRIIIVGSRLYQAVVAFPAEMPPNGRAIAFFLDAFVIRHEESFDESRRE